MAGFISYLPAIAQGLGSIAGAVIGNSATNYATKTLEAGEASVGKQAGEAAGVASGKVDTAAQAATGLVNTATGQANTTLTDAQSKQLEMLRPYIEAGTVSLQDVQKLLSDTGPLGTNNQFKFGPEQWQNDPGYDYLKGQAQLGLERSAAAGGGLLTGGTIKASNQMLTGLASTHLNDAFSRALQEYQTNRENSILRIQGLTGLAAQGSQATDVANADVGNTAARVSTNTLGAGMYGANTGLNAGYYGAEQGLKAAGINEQATIDSARANAAGAIGKATGLNNLIGGLANSITSAVNTYQTGRAPTPASGATGTTLNFPYNYGLHP